MYNFTQYMGLILFLTALAVLFILYRWYQDWKRAHDSQNEPREKEIPDQKTGSEENIKK